MLKKVNKLKKGPSGQGAQAFFCPDTPDLVLPVTSSRSSKPPPPEDLQPENNDNLDDDLDPDDGPIPVLARQSSVSRSISTIKGKLNNIFTPRRSARGDEDQPTAPPEFHEQSAQKTQPPAHQPEEEQQPPEQTPDHPSSEQEEKVQKAALDEPLQDRPQQDEQPQGEEPSPAPVLDSEAKLRQTLPCNSPPSPGLPPTAEGPEYTPVIDSVGSPVRTSSPHNPQRNPGSPLFKKSLSALSRKDTAEVEELYLTIGMEGEVRPPVHYGVEGYLRGQSHHDLSTQVLNE